MIQITEHERELASAIESCENIADLKEKHAARITLEEELQEQPHFHQSETQVHNAISQEVDPRPYKCLFEGCDKAYTLKSVLVRHAKEHTDVRVSCERCGTQFVRPDVLTVHRTRCGRKQ